ncbi:hypothetical protein OROMI_024647 [Orobanche minor]
MTSSQASQSMKKRDHIIDGRLFSRSTVLDRIESETEDVHAMEAIISKLELQNLHRLGRSQTDLYDEQIVEDFFRDASVKLFSRNHGGGVSEVSATVKGVQICIDSALLSTMFGLPSKGLTMEELETFGSEELLTAFWGLFTGNSSNTEVHPSCNKKKFCLPFVYLHDFCCRIIENRMKIQILQRIPFLTAPYDILLSWPELRDEEQFVMEVTDSKDILLLIQWDNQHYSEELHHAAASSSIRHPDSPRTKARKEQLNSLGRQSIFLQDAVEALYKVGKEMDWLNLTAKEEMESVKGELFRIAEVFHTLPQDLKEAFAKFDQLEEQNLLEEQSKLRIVESKTVAVLEYTDSRISDHDSKIDNMAQFIISLDEKLAKFEEQENVLKVLRNIDHTVSELNARKGENEGNHDVNRDSARKSQDQGSRSEHESSRMSSSRHRV